MTRNAPITYRPATWIERNGETIAAILGASAWAFSLGLLIAASWAGAL